jgi:hypothetical protein
MFDVGITSDYTRKAIGSEIVPCVEEKKTS